MLRKVRRNRQGAGLQKAEVVNVIQREVDAALLNLEMRECVVRRAHPSLHISWAQSILVASDRRDGNLLRVHPAPNSPHTRSLQTSCAPEMPGRQSADPANHFWMGSLLET